MNTLAYADLAALLRQVRDGDEARAALLDVLPILTATYGSAAATVAADWYDDLRDAAGAAGAFLAIPAEPVTGKAEPLALWAVGAMFAAEPDVGKTISLAAGGLQRIIANADRDTIAGSVQADPAPTGYRRSAQPDGCAFCKMLATRGTLYNSRQSAERVVGRGSDLVPGMRIQIGRSPGGVKARGKRQLGEKYHDFCRCAAEPVWGGEPEPPEVGEWRAAYEKAFGQLRPGTPDYTKELLSNMREILGSN